MLAWIREDTLATVTGIQVVAIIYLARAVVKLRERVAHIEGKLDMPSGGLP